MDHAIEIPSHSYLEHAEAPASYSHPIEHSQDRVVVDIPHETPATQAGVSVATREEQRAASTTTTAATTSSEKTAEQASSVGEAAQPLPIVNLAQEECPVCLNDYAPGKIQHVQFVERPILKQYR
ncbi:hypothetical protein PtB15_1B721 [Puccinia triticina]|nr:hypothetical protein PtB15_1B721 [Puccinia triticina]